MYFWTTLKLYFDSPKNAGKHAFPFDSHPCSPPPPFASYPLSGPTENLRISNIFNSYSTFQIDTYVKMQVQQIILHRLKTVEKISISCSQISYFVIICNINIPLQFHVHILHSFLLGTRQVHYFSSIFILQIHIT